MINAPRRVVSSAVVLLLHSAVAAAGPVSLDLASPPGTQTAFSVAPGTVVSFTLFNKLPKGVYTISVAERPLVIPPLPTPALSASPSALADACAPILAKAEELEGAADESAVGKITSAVRGALAPGDCTNTTSLATINQWLASTSATVPGEYTVRAGTEVVLTVIRNDKVWALSVSGGARGEWLTSYGISIVPSQDERFFAKAAGDETFTVTAEEEVKDLRMIPTAFFTWISRSQALRNFAFGPTTGLGLTKSKAAVFAGVSATYNWNLAFIAGVAVTPHTRLRGRYGAGEAIKENLSDEQLNRDVFRATWVAAVTYRFAGNPFGGSEIKEEGKKPTEKPTEKPKEEKKE